MGRFEVEKFARLGPKKRLTEEQITYALKLPKSGVSADEIFRELGASSASLYRCKKKYVRIGIPELLQLKALKMKTATLKDLLQT